MVGTAVMWMASENVKQQRETNNLEISLGDQLGTHSFDDTVQEGENCPNTKKTNDSHELLTTEIQDQPSVQGILSQFSTFAGYKITKGYPGEKIKIGTRVVKRKDKPTLPTASASSTDRIHLGTICNVSNYGTKVIVQWDNSVEKETFSVEKDQFDLRLFDNAQTVKHTHSTCNACNKHPLSGIRCKCLNCDDIDLCTFCYMCDAHDVSHIFNRIESEDSKGEKVPPREDIQWTGYKYACGILENAEVSRRNDNQIKGSVLKIHEYGRGREEISDPTSTNEDEEQRHDDDNLPIVTKAQLIDLLNLPMQQAFTHRALQITRCIYETEKKKKDQNSNELVENELGEPVGHAGRLLLNHGYLEDAIKTANKTFLEKDTVSKILNKIWYGEEKTSGHQASVSALRKRFKNYLNDSWNQLDWALMAVYAAAMILKFGDHQTYQDASQILLVATFILLSIRILHMFSMSKFLGPKLVIIHKMFKDTFIFMIILTVIMLSYNVSFHSLLYPNSELSWKEIEKIMENGYWMLFGELNLDRDTRGFKFNFIYLPNVLPGKLLNHSISFVDIDTFEKVQQESEFHWSQLRNGFLEEFSVKTIFPIHLQLLELPFCVVHSIIWFAGFCYKRKTSNKVHHGSINQRPKPVDRETLNGKPMFVRVFLYNTNYDLKLQSTKDEEGIGTSKSKGTIEVMEEDTVTILEELKNIKRYMVKPKKSKVVHLEETHLDKTISTAEILDPEQYEIVREDQITEKGHEGGSIINAVRKNIVCNGEDDLDTNCEIGWTKIQLKGYNDPTPLQNLNSSISRLTHNNTLPNIILTGHFNLPDIDWDEEDSNGEFTIKSSHNYSNEINKLALDIVEEHCLQQCVTKPTRKKNILDLVLTTNENLVQKMSITD
ncbi:unnamed protein product [Mytilus coruscus]|uniref:ZZ-type domain-containing protein n=1 Tax=Mytilus coruscus TaxID=42192 RepID=A0A6J8EQT1_MYTCO|nr:unnamed protein product [Mytilus coruscus]